MNNKRLISCDVINTLSA